MRTTSSLEAFNSAINRSVGKKQHYFKFVERIKLHESRSTDRMFGVVHDELPASHFEPRREVDKARQKKIKSNTELLSNGKISVDDFLNAMAADDYMESVESDELSTESDESYSTEYSDKSSSTEYSEESSEDM